MIKYQSVAYSEQWSNALCHDHILWLRWQNSGIIACMCMCVFASIESLHVHVSHSFFESQVLHLLHKTLVWFSDTTYLKEFQKLFAVMSCVQIFFFFFLIQNSMCGGYVSREASTPGLSTNFPSLKIFRVHITHLIFQWIMTFVGAPSFFRISQKRCSIIWVYAYQLSAYNV